MATEVLCGRCGAFLANPIAPCPRCGAPASGAYRSTFVRRKSPLAAAALGVIPGVGHMYLGQHWKGLALLAGTTGVTLFGIDLDLSVVGLALGIPLDIGGWGLWAYSIVDAYRTARRMEAGI